MDVAPTIEGDETGLVCVQAVSEALRFVEVNCPYFEIEGGVMRGQLR
jgi:hypothetical protein